MYYACLRAKKDKKDQTTAQKIIRIEFATREEARAYLLKIQNDTTKRELYDQFWTE